MRPIMLVAAHKPAPMPDDDLYLPVHVGKHDGRVVLDYQSDAEGENISHLNSSYCELTALYWAWKNSSADAIGLSHYRRYFVGSAVPPAGRTGILSLTEAETLLEQYDVVVAKPRNYVIETIESHYRHGHDGSDLEHLREAIGKFSPGYQSTFHHVMLGRKLSLYNMCLMQREAFDAYCGWLFPILEAFSERVNLDIRDPYQQRAAGYLGERLLNVWTAHHESDLRVGRRRVINTEGEAKVQKGINLLRRKFSSAQGTS